MTRQKDRSKTGRLTLFFAEVTDPDLVQVALAVFLERSNAMSNGPHVGNV